MESCVWHGAGMGASEARRHEMYTGLSRKLGPDLADTLMTYLPTTPGTDLATRDDLSSGLAGVRSEIAELRADFRDLRAEFGSLRGGFGSLRGEFGAFRSEMHADLAAQGQRIDKLQHTLVVGLISIVVALIALIGAVLLG